MSAGKSCFSHAEAARQYREGGTFGASAAGLGLRRETPREALRRFRRTDVAATADLGTERPGERHKKRKTPRPDRTAALRIGQLAYLGC
jgi:hypothetical protein